MEPEMITGSRAREMVWRLIDANYGGNPDALAVDIGCTGSWMRLVLRDHSRALPDPLPRMLGLKRCIAYETNHN